MGIFRKQKLTELTDLELDHAVRKYRGVSRFYVCMALFVAVLAIIKLIEDWKVIGRGGEWGMLFLLAATLFGADRHVRMLEEKLRRTCSDKNSIVAP